jgi:cytochrome c-type biogenesis protein CcmH/NrfG
MKHIIIFLFMLTGFSTGLHAVEVAPRISDREIIESLAELKAGQKSLQTIMNERFKVVEQRFISTDQRFMSLEQRFTSIDQRFEQADKRFDQVDKRFDQIWSLMLVMLAGIFGLIGFIVWDRKTAMKPLEQRLDRIENELHHDLEIQHEQGSKMTRLINALRELAQADPKVAGVLRQFSLL